MAEYIIQSNTLTDIANAIRNKTNKTNTIPVVKFAEEINSLQLDPSFGLPQIDETLPSDASIIVGKSVVCNVLVLDSSEDYTYQWYVNNIAVVDANQSSYTFTGTEFGPTTIYCNVINKNGGISTSRVATITVKSTIPTFTYSGTYKILNDQDSTISQSKGNWKIKFLTSGDLKFTELNGAADGIDVFCVGGGGGGGGGHGTGGWNACGGGGGYCSTAKNRSIDKAVSYEIIIGAGGSKGAVSNSGGTGGTTSAFGVSANGGTGGSWGSGKAGIGGNNGGGTSGGGTTHNGSNGGSGAAATLEFAESNGTRYAGGGGGANGGIGGAGGGGNAGIASDSGAPGKPGTPNTGGGGGGGSQWCGKGPGGAGGSGVVIIRNAR